MLVRFAFVQLFALLSYGLAEDKCSGPFGQFIKCLAVQVDSKLHYYQQEASSEVQTSTKACFKSAKCASPDFNNANVDYFLSEPWSSRVKKFLNILDNMPPKVQQCMIEYFKDQANKKIANCIKDYGSTDIQDFQMPAWPTLKSLDISKLKKMTLNRMVVWNSSLECGKATSDDKALQNTLRCVHDAREGGQGGGNLCQARDKCRSGSISPNTACSKRYDSIQKALCACAKAEISKYNSTGGAGFVSNWRQLKETALQGQMEQEFKKCHLSNNLTYPEQKVIEAKQAVKDAFSDIIKQGSIPVELMTALNTVTSSLNDIIHEWRRAFCSSCLVDDEGAELKFVRASLARQAQASGQHSSTDQSPSLGDQFRSALSG